MNKAHLPIGIFDSGVGGLSVLQHIHNKLRNENAVYIADSKFAPYGDRGSDFVECRSLQIARCLADVPVKALVVACNTATAAAVTRLRTEFSMPVIGIEPGIKPAVALSEKGVIGVLATSETLKSKKFASLLSRCRDERQIFTQQCPGLVEEIEAMRFDGSVLRQLVQQYLQPMLNAGVDTIVLGCTHYAFIRPLIQEVAGASVRLIDTGEAVSNELHRRLADNKLLSFAERAEKPQFYSSDSSPHVLQTFSCFWGGEFDIIELPSLASA